MLLFFSILKNCLVFFRLVGKSDNGSNLIRCVRADGKWIDLQIIGNDSYIIGNDSYIIENANECDTNIWVGAGLSCWNLEQTSASDLSVYFQRCAIHAARVNFDSIPQWGSKTTSRLTKHYSSPLPPNNKRLFKLETMLILTVLASSVASILNPILISEILKITGILISIPIPHLDLDRHITGL